MATLRRGSKGEEVKRMQLLLWEYAGAPSNIAVDGDFGRKTEEALVHFQWLHGLSPDGVCGPITWQALGQSRNQLPVPTDEAQEQERRASDTKDWMTIAEAELGVSENALPDQHNERILEYHRTTTLDAAWAAMDETSWCSSFVNWVMIGAGYTGTNNALAKSWKTWGSGITAPQYGAVTVIRLKSGTDDPATGTSTGYHVGFYISKSATSIKLLGGNQSDQVKYSSFLLSAYNIENYRLPI